jgi:hypothetical protein
LKNENESYWLELINKYILKSFCVTVIGKPSEELMKSIADQDKIRVEERKKELGKKGLKELQKAVDNAQAKNDVYFLLHLLLKVLLYCYVRNCCLKRILSFRMRYMKFFKYQS